MVFMISRLRRASALTLVLAASSTLLTAACQKVPLLAPSGSTITLTSSATALPINGSADIIAQVIEAGGTPPHSGTLVTFTTNLGSVQPSEAETDISGRVIVKYVAGTGSGTATITAISGGVSASGTNAIKIAVGSAAVGGVSVGASPQTLSSNGGASIITATVFDSSGNPVGGVPVSFAIDTATGSSGAGSLSATIVNSEANGRAQTTLTTSRTTTVTATAGIATTNGTTTTAAQTGRVTVTVNTTSSITVGAPNPASPTVNQVVTFTLTAGTSTTASSISRVSVDWGDGQTQSYTGLPAAISHTYRSAGSYLIVVTGIDALGDTATSTQAVTVAQQARPTVSISASANAQPNQTVTFTIVAAVAAGSNATIQSITVDFGDGSQQVLQGNASSVQHLYRSGGTYTVTAIATDSNGSTGSASTVIVVGSGTGADFTFSPSAPKAPATVSFNASNSSAPTPGATITDYSWNFGNGSTAFGSSANQTTIYTAAGTFTVTLTITDSTGRTAVTSKQITVT
jgi:PKD repeat protein